MNGIHIAQYSDQWRCCEHGNKSWGHFLTANDYHIFPQKWLGTLTAKHTDIRVYEQSLLCVNFMHLVESAHIITFPLIGCSHNTKPSQTAPETFPREGTSAVSAFHMCAARG